MELIIGAAIGLIVAWICIQMYRKGVRDGMGMAQGDEPTPVHMPAIPKKQKDEPDILSEQYEQFVNFQPKYTEERNAEV